MNQALGQYGRWNGSGVPFGRVSAELAPGTTITGPDDRGGGIDANAAIAAGSQALDVTAGRSRGKGGQALAAAGRTAGKTFAATAPLEAIPGVGTILHVGATAAAATVALIVGLRKGRLTRKKALALAKKAGIDSEMHTYLARAVRWKQSKRKIERAQIKRKIKNKTGKGKKGLGKAWGKVKTIGRKKDRLEEKMQILDAVIYAEKKGAFDPKPQPSTDVVAEIPPGPFDQIAMALGIPSQVVLPIGLSLGALVLFLLFRPSRRVSPGVA